MDNCGGLIVILLLLIMTSVYQDTSPYEIDTHARSEIFSAVLVTGTEGLCSMVLPMSKLSTLRLVTLTLYLCYGHLGFMHLSFSFLSMIDRV